MAVDVGISDYKCNSSEKGSIDFSMKLVSNTLYRELINDALDKQILFIVLN